jgi:hypothetical protein
LDAKNPYSHYSLDNKDASRFCRGKLFEGVDENGDVVLQRRRNNHWRNEGWNLESDDEDENDDGEEERDEDEDDDGEEERDEDEDFLAFD